ncbi:MAG: hypothetical protein R2882_11110 [Gemmatimonadales bacterium]
MRLTEAGQLGLGLESAPAGPALLDRRSRGTDFLKLKVSRILNPPEATGMPFWSINPYIGCEFGCAYCYARETHRWTAERSGLPVAEPPREAFERKIFVKDGVARTLRKTLDPRKVAGASIMIGTATDPYQPAERRFGVTRSVLEALLGYRDLKLRIVTKSPLVARDADLLAELSRRHRVAVCLSIISLDPDLVRRLEPKTPLPHAGFAASGPSRTPASRPDS